MTVEQYDALYAKQGGRCAICGKQKDNPNDLTIKHGRSTDRVKERVKRLAVDHDHKTNRVRGLLCTYCNAGLGNFLESHALLFRAANYLLKHSR